MRQTETLKKVSTTSDQDVGRTMEEILNTHKCRICGKQCGGPESLDQHWKMSGKCKQKRLARIRQQCELGILPEGHEFDVIERAGGRAWRANGIERALTVMSKQFPLASDDDKKRWRTQVEASEDPRAEIQGIKYVLRLFESDGFCPLTKKLVNVKLPPEEAAKNRRRTAGILAISERVKDRQKAAFLAKWKAEVEKSRRETILAKWMATDTYTELPELEYSIETEQMWAPHLSEKGTNSLTPAPDGLSIGHYWVGRTKDKLRKKLMNKRLSKEERSNTLAFLSKDWSCPYPMPVQRGQQGKPNVGPKWKYVDSLGLELRG